MNPYPRLGKGTIRISHLMKGTQPIAILWPGKYKSIEVVLEQYGYKNHESAIKMHNHSSPLDAQSSYRTIIFHDKNL